MQYCISVIFIINIVSFIHSLITINRAATSNNFYYFYKSVDSFTNKNQQELFCTNLNGQCLSGSDCTFCSCFENMTFVSYEHGCMTYDNAVKALNGMMCLAYKVNASIIPAATEETFQIGTCKKLFSSVYFDDSLIYQSYNTCSIHNILTYSSLNGSEELLWTNENNLHFLISEKNSSKCLQKNSSLNDLAMMSGRVIKIAIDCEDKNGSVLNTCIMFKYAGNYTLDNDLIIQTTTKTAVTSSSSKSITGIIVGISLTGALLIGAIFAFRLFRSRKTKQLVVSSHLDKKENDEGAYSYIKPDSRKEIPSGNYEYIQVKDKLPIAKSMEQINPYYVSSEGSMKNDVVKSDSSTTESIGGVDIDFNIPNKLEHETEASHNSIVTDDKAIKRDSLKGPDLNAENIIYGLESGIYNAENQMYAS